MKIDENSYYWQTKSSYLLNDVRNFNEIFKKDVLYDNCALCALKRGGIKLTHQPF